MTLPFKFVAGLIANALTQAFRIVSNALACTLLASCSAALLILASLQFAGGGSKQGKNIAGLALTHAKRSLVYAAAASVQALALATCASPLVRAAQACSEPIKPKGIFVPCGVGRNLLQKTLGLNSWETNEKKRPATPAQQVQPPHIAHAKETKKPTPRQAQEKKKMAKSNNAGQKKITKKSAKAWESIVAKYLNAKNLNEIDATRTRMALKYPAEYLRAVNAAKILGPRMRTS